MVDRVKGMTADPVQAVMEVLRAHGVLRLDLSPVALREAVSEALEAAEHADTLARQCDEPGCTREVSCGFQTPSGYRRTCFEHSDWKRAHQPGALPGPVVV